MMGSTVVRSETVAGHPVTRQTHTDGRRTYVAAGQTIGQVEKVAGDWWHAESQRADGTWADEGTMPTRQAAETAILERYRRSVRRTPWAWLERDDRASQYLGRQANG